MIGDLIGFNLTAITITRHAKVPSEGGYTWTETALAPIDARVYQFSFRNQREWQDPVGEVKQITHGLLADMNADIVVGHDSYDTFLFDGRTFRVIGIRHYDDVNIPEHYQADCVAM